MIIGAAALLAMAAFIFVLFIRPQDVPAVIPASPIQHLDDRKAAIYDNLRDLQFEYRLGKLSDDDYKQNKHALQRELAVVLAETEDTVKRLGLTVVPGVRASAKAQQPTAKVCPHCKAQFAQALRFCGECGKAMA